MNDAASGQTDEELILQVSQGEQAAFETLYRRIAPRVISYLAARARPPLNAEDIAQETWTDVFRQAKKYNASEGKLVSWLFTIANNRLIDAVRRRQRRPETSLEFEPPGKGARKDSEFKDQKLDALESCLEEIESDFMYVLKLKLKGMSSHEISDQLKVPVPTVDTRASRGRALLRSCVEGKMK